MSANMIIRERFSADVVIVGGGVAGLSTAIRLFNRVESHNTAVDSGNLHSEKLEIPQVMIIEKGADPGSHTLSGAAVDPISLKELIPDFKERNAPFEAEVTINRFYMLTSKAALRVPITPPGMGSKGCLLTSISQFNRWLCRQAESAGAQIFSGFSAVDFIREGETVRGVRLGDKGIDKHGNPKPNVLYGDEIEAKVTILADGVQGCLTKQAVRIFSLNDRSMPQAAVLGIKEIIQLPDERLKPGTAMHTFGYPHDAWTYAGGFIYSRSGPARGRRSRDRTGLPQSPA